MTTETGTATLTDPVPRSGLSLVSLALVVGSTVVYAVLASLNPLLSGSAISVLSLSLLLSIAMAVVFFQPNPDALNPLRVASAIFILIYCIAPLMIKDFNWFFVSDEESLLEKASVLVLGAYLSFCVGYLLGPSARRIARRRVPATNQALLILAGLALIGVGFVAYAAAFALVGGVERIIGGGESRVEFFKGIGWLYWASFFMLPGAALYFTALRIRRPSLVLLHSWPFLLFFTSFILLQGRFRALRGLVCLLVLWHYQVRRIRTTELAVFASAAFALFLFVGYARAPEVRPYLLTDPIAVVRTVAGNFLAFTQAAAGEEVSRIQQPMLALDAFPRRMPYDWGLRLFHWINPFVRFLGMGQLQIEETGVIFFRLARPDLPSWLETGYHTSLVGELLSHFPWFFLFPGVALYGVVLRFLYSRLIQEDRSFIALALYSVLLFPMISMLIVGPTLVIFELGVVTLPILVARILLRDMPVRLPAAFPSGPMPATPPADRG